MFRLEHLNERINSFEYGQEEITNKIPNIRQEHIQTKKNLKMSASEMLSFTSFFIILIGDKVPEDNITWELYILFRKIISILTSPRYLEGHLLLLEAQIPQFLSTYQSLYGELRYKFHNMIHIVRILKENRPLVLFWTMRYESKHRELKQSAVSTSSKVNVLKTLGIRSQLRLAYLRLTGNFECNNVRYNHFEVINLRYRKLYFSHSELEEIIFSVTYVQFHGIQYHLNMVFVIEMNDNGLVLEKLRIYLSKEKKYFYVWSH